MNLSRIIQSVYFAPWAITPQGWQTVHRILLPHLDGTFDPAKLQARMRPDGTIDESTDWWGNPMPKMTVTEHAVTIVPVFGTLLHHADLLDKQCGACSYDDIKRDLRLAMDVPRLNKIVLHMSTPGGMSVGCVECAQLVAECAEFVRVEVVTDSEICSAGYHLAASAHAIKCTPSAAIGAIGCYLAWLDQSVRATMAGLKVKLFSDGIYKGAGTAGTSLTPEQEKMFQGIVDKHGGMFKEHVRAYRVVEESVMQGQPFFGSDAVEAGLADEIVQDVEECFEPYDPDTDY
jgi:ClpP class serine protease